VGPLYLQSFSTQGPVPEQYKPEIFFSESLTAALESGEFAETLATLLKILSTLTLLFQVST
jgi:hypothetical protein